MRRQEPAALAGLTEALAKACEELPATLPHFDAEAPLVQQILPGVTLASLRASLLRDSVGGPLGAFLKEVLKCRGIESSGWRGSGSTQGQWACGTARVQAVLRSDYCVPMPKDLPSAAAQILKLPEHAQGSTLNRLGGSEDRLLVTQTSCAHGVQYGDRFYVQHTHAFEEAPGGRGIQWRQWTRFVWTRPLPWTQTFVRTIIESRGRAEASNSAKAFAALFVSAAA